MVVKTCFVPSCFNDSEHNVNKLFIMVPFKENTRMKWCVAVSRPFTKTKYLYCCEDHFDLEIDMLNWIEYKLIGSRVYMREDVIPHKFINSPKPTEHLTKSQLSSSSRKRRYESLGRLGDKVKRKFGFDRRSLRDTITTVTSQSSPEEEQTKYEIESPSGKCLEVPMNHPSSEYSSADCENELKPEIIYYESEPTPMFSDKIQVNIKPKKMSIDTGTSISVCSCSTNTTHSEANSFQKLKKKPLSISKQTSSSSESSLINSSSKPVNSKNYSELSSAFSAVSNLRQSTPIIIEKSRFYLGLPENTYFIVELIVKHVNMSAIDILICLKKIRLYDSDSRLSDDFGISETYVSKTIQKTMPVLASVFKKFIFWQKRETIQALLPIPFRYKYRNVQSIIDCLEIKIEIPSNVEKQAQSWSQCKKCYTVKYLISATPHGSINFISGGFGGSATDKIMVEKCGFLEALPNGAHVMADRGFKKISSLLFPKQCKLITPPSISSSASEMGSREEVKERKRIAALRIHIKRVIRRLREFKILKTHSCVNHKILHLLDLMIIIACGIINLQNPYSDVIFLFFLCDKPICQLC